MGDAHSFDGGSEHRWFRGYDDNAARMNCGFWDYGGVSMSPVLVGLGRVDRNPFDGWDGRCS